MNSRMVAAREHCRNVKKELDGYQKQLSILDIERAERGERIRQLEIRIGGLADRIEKRKLERDGQLRDKYKLLQEGKKLVQDLSDAKKKLKFLTYAEQILARDGLPAYLIRMICPQLNAAAEYFSELFAEGQIKVRFDIDDGEIRIHIINPTGGESLNDQSIGERRIAALITSFALRDAGVKCNVLILDEPGDGLDLVNARMFALGLGKMKDQFGSIFITSHNQHILEELAGERQIIIEKMNGISKFV